MAQSSSHNDGNVSDESHGPGPKAKSERFNYKLAEDALSCVHHNAIARLYGDSAGEILEHLYRSPAGTIPIILRRLKQKGKDWILARSELNKKWKDDCEKNYYRSKDHRSFHFQRSEKRRLLSCKILMNEIKDALPGIVEPGSDSDSREVRVKEPKVLQVTPTTFLGTAVRPPPLPEGLGFVGTPQMFLHYEDTSLLRDVYRVMAHASELGSSPTAEKVKVAALWRTVIGPMLGMPEEWFHGGTGGAPVPTATPQLSQILCGPQQVYCFFRLHQAVLSRLKVARQLCRERDLNRESVLGHALSVGFGDPMDGDAQDGAALGTTAASSTDAVLGTYGEQSYQAYLNLLNAVVDGSIDSNKYEDSCRVIVGNRGYVCYTLERVITQAVRQLGTLANSQLFRECLEIRSTGGTSASPSRPLTARESPAEPPVAGAVGAGTAEAFRAFALEVRERDLSEDAEVVLVQCCTGGADGDLWVAAEVFPAPQAKEDPETSREPTPDQDEEAAAAPEGEKMDEDGTVEESSTTTTGRDDASQPELTTARGTSPDQEVNATARGAPAAVEVGDAAADAKEPSPGPEATVEGQEPPDEGEEPPAKKARKED